MTMQKKTTKKAVKKSAKKATKQVAKKAAKKTVRRAPAKARKVTPSAEEINLAAYLNYKSRIEQGIHGDETGDWLTAEKSLTK